MAQRSTNQKKTGFFDSKANKNYWAEMEVNLLIFNLTAIFGLSGAKMNWKKIGRVTWTIHNFLAQSLQSSKEFLRLWVKLMKLILLTNSFPTQRSLWSWPLTPNTLGFLYLKRAIIIWGLKAEGRIELKQKCDRWDRYRKNMSYTRGWHNKYNVGQAMLYVQSSK